jgi:hypothetical protein
MAMVKSVHSNALGLLAQGAIVGSGTGGFSRVAVRLEPKDAAQAAATLVKAIAHPAHPDALPHLAHGLLAVAARLEPKDAAATLTEAMTTHWSLPQLAQGLSVVTARMDPMNAAVTHLQAMAKTNDVGTLCELARGLVGLAGRMEPRDAARLCSQAGDVLSQAMAKTGPYSLQQQLAEALSVVAACMERRDAARLCSQAGDILSQALAKTTEFHPLPPLALGLSAVAARMDPKDAARLCSQAAATLTLTMAKITEPNAPITVIDRGNLLSGSAQGLSAVTAHMDPKDAARQCSKAAAILTRAMANEENRVALPELAQGLSAVAARMEPKDAAATLTQAMQGMAKTPDPNALLPLAQGLSAVAARLEPDAAAQLRSQTTATLTQKMAVLTHFMVTAKDPQGEELLAQRLSLLLIRVDPPELSQLSAAVVGVVGPLAGTGYHIVSLATVGPALESLPCSLPTQELVELLKQPTCIDPIRRFILNHLGNRYRHRFADVWEFVRFAKESLPDIDLTSPPQRPEPAALAR